MLYIYIYVLIIYVQFVVFYHLNEFDFIKAKSVSVK